MLNRKNTMKFTTTCFLLFAFIQGVTSQESAENQLASTTLNHQQANSPDSDSTLLFKMSQLLTIMGDYQSASSYERNITERFTGKAIQNHSGVIFVLAAMDFIDPKQLPFILPLELDSKTRLSNTRPPMQDSLNMRDSLLKDAVVQFDLALKSDANFIPGYLNKSSALALLQEYDAAESCIEKGIEHCSTQKMTTDFLVMSGIIAALRGDKPRAAQQMRKALTIGSFLAAQNLNILENKVPPSMKLDGPPPIKGTEQIEWFSLADYLASPSVDEEIMLTPQLRCGMKQKTLSQLYLHVSDGQKQTVVFQETNSKYTAATLRAIILESSADNIQEAYGVPDRILSFPDVLVWVYAGEKIYFRFNYRRVLLGWGVYLRVGS